MAQDATEHHTQVLFDFLTKEAKKAKDVKDAGDPPENNEDETLIGTNSNQDRMPEDRGENTIDAEWGENPTPKSDKEGPNDPVFFSDATHEGFIQGRENMLDEIFNSKKPASETARKFIGEQLEHGKSGDYETSAPLLEKDATLSDLTRGLLED